MNLFDNFNLSRLLGKGCNRNTREVKMIPIDDAYNMIKSQSALIIDVRTPAEYNSMHIESAVNIPSNSFMYMTNLLPKDKNANILVYCLSGSRARNVALYMENLGYKNVYMWDGGSLNQMLDKDVITR